MTFGVEMPIFPAVRSEGGPAVFDAAQIDQYRPVPVEQNNLPDIAVMMVARMTAFGGEGGLSFVQEQYLGFRVKNYRFLPDRRSSA